MRAWLFWLTMTWKTQILSISLLRQSVMILYSSWWRMAIVVLVFAFRNNAVQKQIRIKGIFPPEAPYWIPFKFHCPEFGHMPKPEPITCKGNKGGQASSKGKRPLEKHTGLSREGVRMLGGQSIESSVEALSTGLA